MISFTAEKYIRSYLKYFITFLCLVLLQKTIMAQADSINSCHLIGVQFSGQLPLVDLKKRFGSNLNVGVPYYYKTKKNWLFGVDANYFFGSNLREDVLASFRTPEGTITNADGNLGDVRLNERGWNIYALGGKLWPFPGKNKNAGFITLLGAGYMLHKIKIYDIGKNIAQLNGDLKKGYDRLTGGFALSQFIGYLYLGKNRLTNYYVGIELYEGFTSGLRGYQYDTMSGDNSRRVDMLAGLRVGWLLPLHKRSAGDFYYY